MTSFFKQLDAIYCLCLPQRRPFVEQQFATLGILNIVTIIDAFQPSSTNVIETISNNLVYPVYINSTALVACTLGVQKIMQDIVSNKYNYAMVMEDDVVFLPELLQHANTYITKLNINKMFDITKPYNIYLQSTKPPYHYSGKNGLIRAKVRYGEPIYITNHIACSILLQHIYPITVAFDEYKFIVKQKYNFQEAILLPYVCRELSHNIFRFNTSQLNTNTVFTRANQMVCTSVTQQMTNNKFTIHISDNDIITKKLLQQISNNLEFSDTTNNQTNIIHRIGEYVSDIKGYLIGTTISSNSTISDFKSFIISVRGRKSQLVVQNKFNISPIIGDILLLYSRFFKFGDNILYKYCLIYNKTIICTDSNCIVINTLKMDMNEILQYISCSKYIVTDDIRYIIIANSYMRQGILATFNDTKITDNESEIIQDYCSNTYIQNLKPIIINLDHMHTDVYSLPVNNITNLSKATIIQPYHNDQQLDYLIEALPFTITLKKVFQKHNQHVQILKA